jgi:hypothetical protein
MIDLFGERKYCAGREVKILLVVGWQGTVGVCSGSCVVVGSLAERLQVHSDLQV